MSPLTLCINCSFVFLYNVVEEFIVRNLSRVRRNGTVANSNNFCSAKL